MIGERLKKLRKELRLSQNEFAEKLKIPQTTYSNYENEIARTPPEVLQSITDVFHVNLHWLLTGEGEMFLEPREGEISLLSEEKELLEEIKNDKQLMFILKELKNNELIKSILYSLLKAKNFDRENIEKYLKILKATLE